LSAGSFNRRWFPLRLHLLQLDEDVNLVQQCVDATPTRGDSLQVGEVLSRLLPLAPPIVSHALRIQRVSIFQSAIIV
jgi:hypothetical protein